jgi:hypothetical protein
VYSQPVGGGKPVALTRSTTDSTYAVGYFRNDDRILFTRDKGGNEQNHLYVRELDGSEKDLTPGDKLKAIFGGWSVDGNVFYALTNERDPKFFDLYRYDAKSYERTLLYKNENGMTPSELSRTRARPATTRPPSTRRPSACSSRPTRAASSTRCAPTTWPPALSPCTRRRTGTCSAPATRWTAASAPRWWTTTAARWCAWWKARKKSRSRCPNCPAAKCAA